MGNITIALDDEREKKLRRLAKEKYNGGKGSIAKVLKEGLDKVVAESKRERARKRLIELMEKGFDSGGWLFKKRADLYDRFERKR